MDETAAFFKPRVCHVQPRLAFLECPPVRVVSFPISLDEFVGLKLHWIGTKSVACRGQMECPRCVVGDDPHDYFFAPVYAAFMDADRWTPMILGAGGDLSHFATLHLKGKVWKLAPVAAKDGKKKSLKITSCHANADLDRKAPELERFDITQYLRRRYAIN